MGASPLSFVILSHNFPPQNDAEALCTARLASALAAIGYRVQVITKAHKRSLDASIEQELLSLELEITRVEVPPTTLVRELALMARYGIRMSGASWIPGAVRATRAALSKNPGAVLITRAMPITSNVAGYYCRDRAAAWVPHFSDGYPIETWKHRSRLSRLLLPMHRQWARRITGGADLVTGVCANTCRYIEEKTGLSFREKSYALTHLAQPKLKSGSFTFARKDREFWLAHIGNLMAQRNPSVLIEGVRRAAKRLPALRFLQYGNIDREAIEAVPKSEFDRLFTMKQIDNLSPRDGGDLQRQVDVNVMVDSDYGVDYSGIILSKFPHAVCSGRPLLTLSHEDGPMAEYHRRFGGGILASFRDPASVENAILRLHEAWAAGDRCFEPTTEFMKQFSPEVVLTPFVERLDRLLIEKQVRLKSY